MADARSGACEGPYITEEIEDGKWTGGWVDVPCPNPGLLVVQVRGQHPEDVWAGLACIEHVKAWDGLSEDGLRRRGRRKEVRLLERIDEPDDAGRYEPPTPAWLLVGF